MTPEKTYQHVCEMLHSYDSATGNTAAAKVISDPSGFLRCFNPFYESAAALLLDARERMDKKNVPCFCCIRCKAHDKSSHSRTQQISAGNGFSE